MVFKKLTAAGVDPTNNTLSNNYSILKTFQWVVRILIIVSTIVFILYIVDSGDELPGGVLLYTILLYIFQKKIEILTKNLNNSINFLEVSKFF